VSSKSFETDLQFLKMNGYRTIGIEEFVREHKNEVRNKNRKNVLLTFDDARKIFFKQLSRY
jgi:peptidoglycan/xylan/chitin deacetylase (PgdA/CDA1 family)